MKDLEGAMKPSVISYDFFAPHFQLQDESAIGTGRQQTVGISLVSPLRVCKRHEYIRID